MGPSRLFVFTTVQGEPWCLPRSMSFYCLLIILYASSCFVVIFSFLSPPSFRLTPAMVNNLGKVKALLVNTQNVNSTWEQN